MDKKLVKELKNKVKEQEKRKKQEQKELQAKEKQEKKEQKAIGKESKKRQTVEYNCMECVCSYLVVYEYMILFNE